MEATSNGSLGCKSATVKYILFYHPKEERNVEDIIEICSSIGCNLLVVPRDGTSDRVCKAARCVDLDEALSLSSECALIALETCGIEIPTDAALPKGRCISVVLGAEDYGLPRNVIDSLKGRGVTVVKLPMSRFGVSYNVVTSLIILLTELEIEARCEERR